MDLVLFESQGPEFVVVSNDRGGTFGGFGTLGIRPGSLRANISETPPVVLINEQGEEEKRRYEREFFWYCVGGGRGWRGTKRRRA
jgi:hypothetical protein